MKYIYILLILYSFLSCKSTHNTQPKRLLKVEETVGKATRTKSQTIPYIYSNGYSSYEIVLMKHYSYLKQSFYELKFNNCHNPGYCYDIMRRNFGIHNKEILSNFTGHTINIWNGVDLFNDGRKYTVGTFGVDLPTEVNSSVFVLNDKNEDVLSQDSVYRKAIIKFFDENIRTIE